MGRKVILATSALNQWALDFDGNSKRIVESIQIAKDRGATYRTGPELEITGYGCADHFYESDTFLHAWETVAELITNHVCKNILYDVGMPVMHRNVAYNCRVVLFNRRIVLIRPKMILANDAIYRETRWFTAWQKPRQTEDYYLPRFIRDLTKQAKVPFGDAVISTYDTCIGYEVCEELWNPESPHVPMSLDGVEIFVNGSGSYTEIRKCQESHDLIKSATRKCGGCYLFANQKGCDGDRVYYPGNASIALNGDLVAALALYTLTEVDVITATVDLEGIRSYRNSIRSRSHHAAKSSSYPRIEVNFSLSNDKETFVVPSAAVTFENPTPAEEILYGPACWLWDYLRRSGQGGFLLPLSGGADSAATSVVVYSMCVLVHDAISNDNMEVIEDVRRILGQPNYKCKSPRDLCNQIFHTVYLATENSSKKTKDRAKKLAQQIGSYHLPVVIDTIVSGMITVFNTATGKVPKYKAKNGTAAENIALQNLQARLRMVSTYFFAQLLLWVRGRTGSLLVLGSSNVDECIRGYMTKYDCSSADINPIGGFSKADLSECLLLAKDRLSIPILDEIVKATPTAELEPLVDGETEQNDEDDMGMTYNELSTYGKLRKVEACGPYSMFCRLMNVWNVTMPPNVIAEKVKFFFKQYSINRHKMTVLTPSYHAEPYSPDDHRFDHRPFLYNTKWNRQFRSIDHALEQAAVPQRPSKRQDPVVAAENMSFNASVDVIEESMGDVDDMSNSDDDEGSRRRNSTKTHQRRDGDTNKKKSYKHKFQKRWLQVDEFKDWIKPSQKGINYFYCTACLRDCYGGTSSVKHHASCKKHKRNMENLKTPQYILSLPTVEPKTEDDVVHQVWI